MHSKEDKDAMHGGLRVAIEISGLSMEQESKLATIISEDLADAGFNHVFVIASESVFSDPKAAAHEEVLTKEQPIVTVVSTKLH